MIRDAFSPNPDNPDLDVYLSSNTATRSAEIAQYNEHISEFRTRLQDHVTYLDYQSATTTKLQEERLAAKTLTSTKRFASYWSFDAASSASKAAAESSLDVTTDPFNEHDYSRKPLSRSDRVLRLKKDGWPVNKEMHGHKGVEFYDRLCRDVEAELAFAGC
jgi:hypothetical protein